MAVPKNLTIDQARMLPAFRRTTPDDPIRPVDRYTIGHGMVGFMLGLWDKLPWWGVLGMSIGWELAEVPLKKIAPSMFPSAIQDTIENSMIDTTVWMMGYGVSRIFAPEKKLPGQR